MKTIHKYTIDPFTSTLLMPLGAKPLSVQVQRGEVRLWCEVDDSSTKVLHEVHVYGTGHDITHDSTKCQFVGTFQLDNGQLVFHVYVECSEVK